MFFKRLILIIAICILTVICYLFMNRNYDPLARWNYDNEIAKQVILERLDERQIEYIVEYAIAPEYIMPFIYADGFNAYHITDYQKAQMRLYLISNLQDVEVIEMIYEKGLDIDTTLDKLADLDYDAICWELDHE